MSSPDSDEEIDWNLLLFKAAGAYANDRLEAFARSTIYWLQRLDASGIFGEDYPFRSIWDEYCHYKQVVDYHPVLDNAFSGTLDPIIEGVVRRITPRERDLLATASARLVDDPDAPNDDSCIMAEVRSVIDRRADDRPMDRFYVGLVDPRYPGT